MNELLSIIVPVYNSGKFICKCINSILSQTYSNYEIICVNDGSEDDSVEILHKYAQTEDRLRVIDKNNEGLAAARITGILESKGELIGFVDSDDWIEPNTYKTIIDKMQLDDAIDVGIGSYITSFEEVDVDVFNKSDEIVIDKTEALARMYECKIYNWSVWDKVYRRSLFDQERLFERYRNFKYGEDTFLSFHLIKNARKVVYTPVMGYHYRIHDESMMRKPFSNEMFSYFDIWNGIAQWLDSNKLIEAYTNLARIIVRDGSAILNRAESQYQHFKYYIEKYKMLLSNYAIKLMSMDKLNDLVYKYDYVMRSEQEIEEDQEGIERIIKNLASNYKKIVLYGAGIIANEAAGIMEKNMTDYQVVVTKATAQNRIFHGKTVYDFNSFLDEHNNYDEMCVVIAMNYRHYLEVYNILSSYFDNNQLFNYGEHSFSYR